MSHSRVLPSLALTGVLVLSGCQADSTTAVQAEYEAAQPFVNSDTPAKHVGLLNSEDVRFEAERGLMDLSRQYFPPSDVTFRTHTFLDFDELDATDGSRGLLGTLRDDNSGSGNSNGSNYGKSNNAGNGSTNNENINNGITNYQGEKTPRTGDILPVVTIIAILGVIVLNIIVYKKQKNKKSFIK